MRKNILLLFVISIFAIGCSKKDSSTDNGNGMSSVVHLKLGEAKAKIVVYSRTGSIPDSPYKTPNAKVSLFNEVGDAIDNKNVIATGITDAKAICTFTGLKKGATYYVRVENEKCFSNLHLLRSIQKLPIYGVNTNSELKVNDLDREYVIFISKSNDCK